MKEINIENVLREKMPKLFTNYPKFISQCVVGFLKWAFHLNSINKHLAQNENVYGIDFVYNTFKFIGFNYKVDQADLERIPKTGRLLIASNHPLGGMDGLALIAAVYGVRKDVRILANDVLMNLTNIENLFLPVNIFFTSAIRSNLNSIKQALENEEALIFFPAAKVSRLSFKGIKDVIWNKGIVRFAQKYNSPILPVYLKAKNSTLFYILSSIFDSVGTFLLPHEAMNKRGKVLNITIGKVIDVKVFNSLQIAAQTLTDRLRDHIYSLKKNPNAIYNPKDLIINEVNPLLIKKELFSKATLLGSTKNNEYVFSAKFSDCPNVIMEISRLREITFRSVGEGTGKSADTDEYDKYYDHIVLWNNSNKDIVGSYRLGNTKKIVEEFGSKGLYNAQQFTFQDSFKTITDKSIEVGRSFIQKKYWKSNALDYLWNGIGLYIKHQNNIRYLWGGVSITDSFNTFAKSLIVRYYQKWYKGTEEYAKPKNNFALAPEVQNEIDGILTGQDHLQDYKLLKKALHNIGLSVPVLYRKYSEMTNYGGTKIYEFSVNKTFNSAIDSLIVIDLDQIRNDYKERYFGSKGYVKENPSKMWSTLRDKLKK
ncbi:MAG: lysophospholipid acyltransferase family protein [bacterium]